MDITYLVDLCVKGIQVYEQVDTSLCKRTHTAAVIASGIDMIYPNGIGS